MGIQGIEGNSLLDVFSGSTLRVIVISSPVAGKLDNVDTSDYDSVMEALSIHGIN